MRQLLALLADHVVVLLEGVLQLQQLGRRERRPDPLRLPERLKQKLGKVWPCGERKRGRQNQRVGEVLCRGKGAVCQRGMCYAADKGRSSVRGGGATLRTRGGLLVGIGRCYAAHKGRSSVRGGGADSDHVFAPCQTPRVDRLRLNGVMMASLSAEVSITQGSNTSVRR